MIVVSDTSPINYLLLIGQIELLPRLFEQIIIPDDAASQGLIDLAEAIAQLQQTNFRISRRIIRALLQQKPS